MSKAIKRILAVFLVVIMAVGAVPPEGVVGLKPHIGELFGKIFLLEAKVVYSGACRDNVMWSLNAETGVQYL